MTIVVKSSTDDAITIPSQLMAALNLQEGDEVKAIVDGETLRLARLSKFLDLRGALADDKDFEHAMESNEQAWQAWTKTTSS